MPKVTAAVSAPTAIGRSPIRTADRPFSAPSPAVLIDAADRGYRLHILSDGVADPVADAALKRGRTRRRRRS
jgi:hypothetical protein